ncbi:hypothetical protein Acor_73560 [Acrocarpospora corrugata]|uniref:Uncharacterized protein n=1 Tax=Acrocarpospora corrugata TaxID=35763 RepID=A0A5M3WFY0_9ACTN|nr:hypothetical protein Acor_73560 [Acrocarpospora corrugata]
MESPEYGVKKFLLRVFFMAIWCRPGKSQEGTDWNSKVQTVKFVHSAILREDPGLIARPGKSSPPSAARGQFPDGEAFPKV